MREGERVAEFVVEDAHRGAVADTREAAGLPAGVRIVNIEVV
jgi:hypothetical protein